MKELGVIATLIALGFGTSRSVAYVFNESCRLMEAHDDAAFSRSVIAATAAHNDADGIWMSCHSFSALD